MNAFPTANLRPHGCSLRAEFALKWKYIPDRPCFLGEEFFEIFCRDIRFIGDPCEKDNEMCQSFTAYSLWNIYFCIFHSKVTMLFNIITYIQWIRRILPSSFFSLHMESTEAAAIAMQQCTKATIITILCSSSSSVISGNYNMQKQTDSIMVTVRFLHTEHCTVGGIIFVPFFNFQDSWAKCGALWSNN